MALATGLRLAWVLTVPTVPVSDFAMYRESANYLSEFGRLDHGFIYMPGFVVLLAWIKDLGGELLAQKMLGVFFGGLGAAGLYAATAALFEQRRVAIVATLGYALWPAGVAMSSVVGTDMPAAALLVSAIAVLAALGPTRPWRAALLFGVVMGLAAWVRAVALPLTGLSLGYWLARRTRLPAALALTAAAVAATLLVLSPWAIRHARESGHAYFTDDHGGVTALIGANPNSEGTYTRALNQMFRDLTGRGVLDEPHHEVDQAAYALAKDWTRFEPAYALGLGAKRAERLFDSERYLLYWPIFRPGVLVGPRGVWFAERRERLCAAVDAFGAALAALYPLSDDGFKYYDHEDNRDDKGAKGRALHVKLLAAWADFDKAVAALDPALETYGDKLDEARLAKLAKRPDQRLRYLHAKLMNASKKVVTVAASVDQPSALPLDAFHTNVAALASAVDELGTYATAHKQEVDDLFMNPVIRGADDFLKSAKNLERRKRDKVAYSDGERATIGANNAAAVDGSPGQVIDTYNRLIGESNGLRWR